MYVTWTVPKISKQRIARCERKKNIYKTVAQINSGSVFFCSRVAHRLPGNRVKSGVAAGWRCSGIVFGFRGVFVESLMDATQPYLPPLFLARSLLIARFVAFAHYRALVAVSWLWHVFAFALVVVYRMAI